MSSRISCPYPPQVAGLPEPVEVGGRRLVVEDRAGTLDVLALIEKERRAPMPAVSYSWGETHVVLHP